ncbi:MAG: hypothetical protein ACJ8C3_25610 [Microvirga sp.]|jgi:hypothetical protein|nr:hypothetical protein [Beijerinckiaceae bacterium]
MADVPVDARSWNGISDADKQRVTEILRSSGLIGKADKLAGADQRPARAGFAAPNPACVLGCNAAEAVAIAGCQALPPPLNGICVAAAHAAADYCRSRC